ARQTLARLIGLPVPDDTGRYPALDDQYHDLMVGPCSPEEIAAWEENPWVQGVSFSEPGWDCDYPTWAASFGKAVPTAPFELAPASGVAEETPGGTSVERHGDGWVVRDGQGWYWCGLVENGWDEQPDNEYMPALTFPTEAAARAAYAQAAQMYGERAQRH